MFLIYWMKLHRHESLKLLLAIVFVVVVFVVVVVFFEKKNGFGFLDETVLISF